jgi:hypothetical protein
MGRTKLIEHPEDLIAYFKEYQDYCKANPVMKEDYVGKDAMRVYRELERPLTWVGFECYLSDKEIINDLGDYESNKDGRYEDYATIISRIKKYIENDQFTGATVGIYNHNIIARKLGLVDKQESKLEGAISGSVTDSQFNAILEAVRNNASTDKGE